MGKGVSLRTELPRTRQEVPRLLCSHLYSEAKAGRVGVWGGRTPVAQEPLGGNIWGPSSPSLAEQTLCDSSQLQG